MINRLWGDTETFSPIPLKHGSYRYATAADVMLFSWAWNAGTVELLDLTLPRNHPSRIAGVRRLSDAIRACDEAWFQNAMFDRTLLTRCPDLPAIPLEKWRCMMVRAYMHGLPGKLEKLSEIFKLGHLAKIEGKWLIDTFCKPTPSGKRNTRLSHPMEWDCFEVYAKQDIAAMRALDGLIPMWNCIDWEWHLWHLDQQRNDRGFQVDTELAEMALKAVEAETKRLGDRTDHLTGGEVLKATQRDKLLKYLLAEYGVELPDLRADTVERRLEDPELPDQVKELLRIRLRATKASAGKYRRVRDSHVNGRLHGTVQFGGAQRTLRDAGRIFQPQNLPRLDEDAVASFYMLDETGWQDFPKKQRAAMVDDYLALALASIKDGTALPTFGDGLMFAASNLLRGSIIAAPGMKLVISDLSNIEGRKLAWMAGEEWKLVAFRAFDAGQGKDLYILAYARAFDCSPERVDDVMRQIGKVMELALGYQGGVGAFAVMAVTYGIDLAEMAERAWSTIPAHILSDSRRRFYQALGDRKRAEAAETMGETIYVVCQSLVTLWRNAHPATVKFWWAVENAAKSATVMPGRVFKAGPLAFDRLGNWLRMQLPSGRYLCYPSPRLSEEGDLSYAGVNQYNRQWCRIGTYAGKLVENADQASSRDVLKHGEDLADMAGYPCVLVVHDELVTETPDDPRWNEKGLSQLMATVPSWAKGLPLAAKGFETKRYKKG